MHQHPLSSYTATNSKMIATAILGVMLSGCQRARYKQKHVKAIMLKALLTLSVRMTKFAF